MLCPMKTFNPRFEDDFAKGRDYDPDREKADERRLKKEVISCDVLCA